MNYEDLTPEQKAKVKECASPEELLQLAKDEGYEMTDAQLEAIAGGKFWDDDVDWCSDKARCKRWFPK